MADLQFADLGNALAQGAAAGRAGPEIEYRNALIRQKDRELAREEADAPHVSALLKGDRTALDRVSPQTAIKLAPYLDKMDAAAKTRAKETADYTYSAANAILQADPAERPAIYQQVIADGKARGLDLSRLPPQYTPQMDPMLRTYRQMAVPVLEHFKSDNKGLDPLPGQGGAAGAISGIESGGRYDAVGPVADAQGNRAYGKYQVLSSNIAPWTQEILGKSMSPQEFLANPQAQDQVFNAKFGQYVKQYGSPEAASRAWFAGPGGMNNPNAKDVLGTTVQGYGAKFSQAYGPGATGPGPGPQISQGDNTRGDASGNPLQPASDPRESVRGLKLPQGAVVRTINGVPVVKDGAVLITGPDGKPDFVPLPTRADPKSETLPPGFRWNADRTAHEVIPGSVADPAQIARTTEAKRRADEKAIPQTVTKGIQENLTNLKQIDKALSALDTNPGSIGGAGSIAASIIPGASTVQNWMDKDGVDVRALIADIGSLIIHDRSGAAVTASEMPRLKPFIPNISDDPETAKKKLRNFKARYEEIIRDTTDYYGPNNGFREYTPASQYMGTGKPDAQKPGGSADAGGALFEARDAISKGAPRDAVIERLIKMGVDPSGL